MCVFLLFETPSTSMHLTGQTNRALVIHDVTSTAYHFCGLKVYSKSAIEIYNFSSWCCLIICLIHRFLPFCMLHQPPFCHLKQLRNLKLITLDAKLHEQTRAKQCQIYMNISFVGFYSSSYLFIQIRISFTRIVDFVGVKLIICIFNFIF